jgi:hypothetical protein
VGNFFAYGSDSVLFQDTNPTDQDAYQAELWQINGTSLVSATPLQDSVPAGWLVAGIGEFWGDGVDDILWTNPTTGGVAIWQMAGATAQNFYNIGNMGTGWQVAGVADFFPNGFSDILWQNTASSSGSFGQVEIWEMQGQSVIASNVIGTLPSSGGWNIIGVGAFAGGSQEILLQQSGTNNVATWQTDGTTTSNWTVIGTAPTAAAPQIGDFYGNGEDEIVWQAGSTLQLWQVTGSSVTSSTISTGVPSGWQIVHNPTLAA